MGPKSANAAPGSTILKKKSNVKPDRQGNDKEDGYTEANDTLDDSGVSENPLGGVKCAVLEHGSD